MNEVGPDVLSSTSNPTIKRLVRLRDNRQRRRAGRVLVDGWRESARAVEAGLELLGCYVPQLPWPLDPSDASPQNREAVATVLGAATAGKLVRVTEPLFEKISYGQSPRGVVAEFVAPDRSLARLELPPAPLILVLDGVEKPGNVGAIFRCADAAGVDAVILASGECDLHNPNAIRASLGAVFTVASAVGTRQQVHDFLVAQEIHAIAARVESSEPLDSVSMQGPLAILLGSEAEGLGEHWTTLGEQAIPGVRIPMAGRVDSLNVSVSAALLAYEAVRRRTGEPGKSLPSAD